ncbi:hypothetical protein BGZ94_007889 [Podila epigama]|nr:hypothetical protein BGZ94_007889 [Podila epigama]
MCIASASQTVCLKNGCSKPIYVEYSLVALTTIRHPFCSKTCARACGEKPRHHRHRSPAVSPSPVTAVTNTKNDGQAAAAAAAVLGTTQPLQVKYEKPSKSDMERSYPSPPYTPYESD